MREPTSAESAHPQTAESHADSESDWDVFISYASVDRHRVMGIVEALTHTGLRVWIDGSGLPAGVNYGPEIVAAIKQSRAVLLACSAAAFSSRNVRQEVALAWKHECPIVPLLLEPLPIPDDLAYWLEGTQWVEVLDRPRDAWLWDLTQGLHQLGIAVLEPVSTASENARWRSGQWLPTPLTAILGRDAEVAEVAALLSTHRLVTLSGPGGVGKTRLAIAAAHTAAPAFPDGGAFVDLAPVRDPALVTPTVALALGVRETPGAPLAKVLSAAIGERRLLLVLDNFEQVLEAAPEIAGLLTTCPQTVVLATSRAPLAVRGERVVSVEPLPTPSPAAPLADQFGSPGARLFAERAAETQPDFVLTADNISDVAAICARLDGLPLAIELAAARVKLLGLGGLLAKLESRLPLLTSGPRDLPARQQTLADAIAWSYELLTAEEQMLFRRLAVFVGGWTVEAAESVCGPGGSLNLFEGLASLVDKSMVRQEGASLLGARFGMLEAIREYGAERLMTSGEEEAVRTAHATFFAKLVTTTAPPPLRFGSAEQTEWISNLTPERANVRDALAWLVDRGDAAQAVPMAAMLGWFWGLRGELARGRADLDQALKLARAGGQSDWAAALLVAAFLAWDEGDTAAATCHGEESLALFRTLGDRGNAAIALQVLGTVAQDRGEADRADALLQEAFALHLETGQSALAGAVLSDLAAARRGYGDLETAKTMCEQAVVLADGAGQPLAAVYALYQLGQMALTLQDPAEAESRLHDALERSWAFRYFRGMAFALEGMAALAGAKGQPERAAQLFGSAEAAWEAAGKPLPPLARPDHDQAVAAVQARLSSQDFAAAWTVGRKLSLDEATKEALLATPSQT